MWPKAAKMNTWHDALLFSFAYTTFSAAYSLYKEIRKTFRDAIDKTPSYDSVGEYIPPTTSKCSWKYPSTKKSKSPIQC